MQLIMRCKKKEVVLQTLVILITAAKQLNPTTGLDGDGVSWD